MILDAIKDRRSVRKYKDTVISNEQIETLLHAAMLSPSACNTRPWRFIAITERHLLDALAEAHPYGKMIHTAPLCIVIVALPHTQDGVANGLAEGFWPQDCGAVTQTILVQAEAMGFGSCWCGVYPKEKTTANVASVLSPENGTQYIDLSAGEVIFSLIAIGEKDEFPNPRGTYDENKVMLVR